MIKPNDKSSDEVNVFDYSFFVAQLRFAATRTQRDHDDIGAMMNVLLDIASQIEHEGSFRVAQENVRLGARALAGVAGFLQQHILPEVIANQNKIGEQQVRLTIDIAMSLMASMVTHAEMHNDTLDLELPMPNLTHDLC